MIVINVPCNEKIGNSERDEKTLETWLMKGVLLCSSQEKFYFELKTQVSIPFLLYLSETFIIYKISSDNIEVSHN